MCIDPQVVLVVVVVVVVVVFTLKAVPICNGPTDANAFRGHRLTTQKGSTLRKKTKRSKRTQKSQHTRDNWKRKEKKNTHREKEGSRQLDVAGDVSDEGDR